uniref:Uncharacterized protein n=1 Tax=viral metagenome TaxID=1070528 RepID=A0A6C0CMC6_9ZZZZ
MKLNGAVINRVVDALYYDGRKSQHFKVDVNESFNGMSFTHRWSRAYTEEDLYRSYPSARFYNSPIGSFSLKASSNGLISFTGFNEHLRLSLVNSYFGCQAGFPKNLLFDGTTIDELYDLLRWMTYYFRIGNTIGGTLDRIVRYGPKECTDEFVKCKKKRQSRRKNRQAKRAAGAVECPHDVVINSHIRFGDFDETYAECSDCGSLVLYESKPVPDTECYHDGELCVHADDCVDCPNEVECLNCGEYVDVVESDLVEVESDDDENIKNVVTELVEEAMNNALDTAKKAEEWQSVFEWISSNNEDPIDLLALKGHLKGILSFDEQNKLESTVLDSMAYYFASLDDEDQKDIKSLIEDEFLPDPWGLGDELSDVPSDASSDAPSSPEPFTNEWYAKYGDDADALDSDFETDESESDDLESIPTEICLSDDESSDDESLDDSPSYSDDASFNDPDDASSESDDDHKESIYKLLEESIQKAIAKSEDDEPPLPTEDVVTNEDVEIRFKPQWDECKLCNEIISNMWNSQKEMEDCVCTDCAEAMKTAETLNELGASPAVNYADSDDSFSEFSDF